MKQISLILVAVCLFLLPARAFAQPTVMDLIKQAQDNNAALSVRIAETSAKVDALGAALNAQARQMADMQAKLDKIHVAIVRDPTLIAQPAAAVFVPTPGRSLAMQGPGGAIAMEAHGGMMGQGACAGGSCGSGRTRMVARMRSR